MTPAVGQVWRHGTAYRVTEIDLSRIGGCVRVELVEPSEALVGLFHAQAELNRRYQTNEPSTWEAVRDEAMARPLWLELQWFERAATFVRSAA